MTITKCLYNLTAGTRVYCATGDIILTSDYDSFHGWYTYNDIEYDENGEGVEVNNRGAVTPSDLIGCEIF